MKKAEWALTERASLGGGVAVTLTVGPAGFVCEWEPDVPKAGSLKQGQYQKYIVARHKLLQQCADRMGGNVLVIE